MGMEERLNLQCGDLVPHGIKKRRGRSTGSAWDNFDINMETLNGLGTIHHTYGIVYQNVPEEDDSGTGDDSPSLQTKRTYRAVTQTNTDNDDIEPYYKKPKPHTMNLRISNFYHRAHWHLNQTEIPYG